MASSVVEAYDPSDGESSKPLDQTEESSVICHCPADERTTEDVSYCVTRRLLRVLYECHPVEQDVFLKGHDIKVAIVCVERDIRGHPMNPNLYTIQLKHGDFIWSVKRRFKHFTALRRTLFLSHYRGLRRGRVPALPIRPDIAVRRTGAVAERRKHALEQFLRKLLENPLYRKHEETEHEQYLKSVYKSIDNESQSTAPSAGGEVVGNTEELATDTDHPNAGYSEDGSDHHHHHHHHHHYYHHHDLHHDLCLQHVGSKRAAMMLFQSNLALQQAK